VPIVGSHGTLVTGGFTIAPITVSFYTCEFIGPFSIILMFFWLLAYVSLVMRSMLGGRAERRADVETGGGLEMVEGLGERWVSWWPT